jgi:hypothetical protein
VYRRTLLGIHVWHRYAAPRGFAQSETLAYIYFTNRTTGVQLPSHISEIYISHIYNDLLPDVSPAAGGEGKIHRVDSRAHTRYCLLNIVTNEQTVNRRTRFSLLVWRIYERFFYITSRSGWGSLADSCDHSSAHSGSVKTQGIFWLSEQLLASQEGFWSM